MATHRLAYIDIAKAIGLCLVLMSHTAFPQLMYFADSCYIAIFFITAGFTTNHINITLKAKRLLLPYSIFNILLITLYGLYNQLNNSFHNIIFQAISGALYSRYCFYPLGQADNIYLLKAGNAPLWFLTSMFTAYIALIPLVKWPKMRGGGNCRIHCHHMDSQSVTNSSSVEY